MAHPGITMRSLDSSRPPSLQRSPSKQNVEPPMLLGICCNCLMVLGPGVSANQLAVTHQFSILTFGHPASGIQGSRPFKVYLEQYRSPRPFKDLPGTVQVLDLTQPPRLYSTHGKTGCTTHQWVIGWYSPPHITNIPQCRGSPDHLAVP